MPSNTFCFLQTESILAAIQLLEEKGMDTNFLNVSLLRSYSE